MTMRLSMSSLAGTARTLVAVGTARLAAMFCAVRAAAPRSLVSSASCGSGAAGAWGWLTGWGWLVGWLTVGALGAAPGALGLGAGGGATSVSAEPLSRIVGCGPVPFPRVGR